MIHLLGIGNLRRKSDTNISDFNIKCYFYQTDLVRLFEFPHVSDTDRLCERLIAHTPAMQNPHSAE